MLLSARAAAPIETVVFVFIVSPDAPRTGELIDGCAGRGLIRNIVCAPIRWVRRLWRERMERATAVDARGQAAGGAPMRVGMLAVAGNVSILKRSRAANRLGRRSLRWRMPAAISARSRSTRRRRRRAAIAQPRRAAHARISGKPRGSVGSVCRSTDRADARLPASDETGRPHRGSGCRSETSQRVVGGEDGRSRDAACAQSKYGCSTRSIQSMNARTRGDRLRRCATTSDAASGSGRRLGSTSTSAPLAMCGATPE